jgi:SprT protein
MNRFVEFTARTRKVIADAERLFGVKIDPVIAYNLRGKVAGWASCKRCRITGQAYNLKVRFNQDLIRGDHYQDMLDETLPHEIAHLVCFVNPALGRKHDSGWRRVCLALGGNGNTRHSYDVEYARGTFRYRASCGTVVEVSSIIHKRIQAGQRRRLPRTGGILSRNSPFSTTGEPGPLTERAA